MASNLFVTGFPYELTQDELAKIFSACGTVTHVKILTDRDNGRSRGIGFVKMSSDAEGDAAIAKLNNTPLGERTLFVEAAKPPVVPTPREGRQADASGNLVERRSGKDRRRQPVGPWDPSDRRNNSGAAAPAPSAERKWEPRPAAFGEKRSFGDKKPFGERKPFGEKKSFGDKKPWEKKPFGEKKSFGDKKPWEKKPFGDKPSFGDKKPWEKKPFGEKKAFGERKPWEKKPGDEGKSFGDRKPWEKKSFHDIPSISGGKKPFGERKPWEKKPFDDAKPGGFAGKKPWEKKPFGDKKPGGFGPKKRFFKPGGFGGKGRSSPGGKP
jgi:RNA recognition motif-containing protein